jgi:hypothetical protein
MVMIKDVPRPGGPKPLDIGYRDHGGRILVADSMSYYDERVEPTDVLVCGSFAGAHIADQLGLCWGPRGLIAHACGVGKDDAGISGLEFCQQVGVPMAAVETMSARISDGRSVFDSGVIGHANTAAQDLGVRVGQPTGEAARHMLDAPAGTPLESNRTDTDVHTMHEGATGRVIALWNPLLLVDQGPFPHDVFCIALHSGKVMAEWSSALLPKGVIGNDGGFGKDRTGVVGLTMLEDKGIAAASVAAMSARIGDCRSTYEDGVISAVNDIARGRGVREGMPAKDAARLMLEG